MGKFGSVWKARDTQLDRIVAVTVPRKDQLSSAEAEMFFREARTAAQLKHPNIVGVHEVGRQGESIFIVSDFVQGANLHEWLSAQRLTPREAAELCAKIADAVAHAHASGVVHRDLKPGNIMLDADGQPHITDFGLAKREAGEITMTLDGAILGTPAYMSPEQARGEAHQADARSDVYSLGVILFELLTGELPFRGETRMLIVQILNDEPPSPRKLNARIPRDLETICLKCLEKDPKRRYASATELSAEMRRFLDAKPILARPISRAARLWRLARRNPVAASLSATLILVVVTVAAVAPIIAVHESSIRHEQEQLVTKLESREKNYAIWSIETALGFPGPASAASFESGKPLEHSATEIRAARTEHDRALETWRQIHAQFEVGRRGVEAEKEALSRYNLWRARARLAWVTGRPTEALDSLEQAVRVAAIWFQVTQAAYERRPFNGQQRPYVTVALYIWAQQSEREARSSLYAVRRALMGLGPAFNNASATMNTLPRVPIPAMGNLQSD